MRRRTVEQQVGLEDVIGRRVLEEREGEGRIVRDLGHQRRALEAVWPGFQFLPLREEGQPLLVGAVRLVASAEPSQHLAHLQLQCAAQALHLLAGRAFREGQGLPEVFQGQVGTPAQIEAAAQPLKDQGPPVARLGREPGQGSDDTGRLMLDLAVVARLRLQRGLARTVRFARGFTLAELGQDAVALPGLGRDGILVLDDRQCVLHQRARIRQATRLLGQLLRQLVQEAAQQAGIRELPRGLDRLAAGGLGRVEPSGLPLQGGQSAPGPSRSGEVLPGAAQARGVHVVPPGFVRLRSPGQEVAQAMRGDGLQRGIAGGATARLHGLRL